MSGYIGKGRPKRTYRNQIKDVLKIEQVNSWLSWQACVKALVRDNDAKDVCTERSKWKTVVPAYPDEESAWNTV